MDAEVCARLLNEIISGLSSSPYATFFSTLAGAITGGAISWLTAKHVLNRTQINERNVRLYSMVIEIESLTKEMFFNSYRVAGEVKSNKENLEDPTIKSNIYDLANKFWIASNRCRDIIDRVFPEMKQNHEELLRSLRVFPDYVGSTSLGINMMQFEKTYSLETLNNMSMSLELFSRYLLEVPRVKEAYTASYGI